MDMKERLDGHWSMQKLKLVHYLGLKVQSKLEFHLSFRVVFLLQ